MRILEFFFNIVCLVLIPSSNPRSVLIQSIFSSCQRFLLFDSRLFWRPDRRLIRWILQRRIRGRFHWFGLPTSRTPKYEVLECGSDVLPYVFYIRIRRQRLLILLGLLLSSQPIGLHVQEILLCKRDACFLQWFRRNYSDHG